MPIVLQIQNLFAKSDFNENLRHRFRRTKTNENHFEDIYDGSEYKKHCNPGILDFQQNISLLWNPDGVPVFKSLSFSYSLEPVTYQQKCLVCNSVQYNGSYGCLKCKQRSETVKVSARGHMPAFPFIKPDLYGPKRTHSETLRDADTAVESGKAVDGIKGPSWFAGLSNYDVIKGTAIDYMYGLCLGVMKTLLSLWFASKNSAMPFSICDQVSKADKRLLQIHPPLEIGRIPRSIENHRKYWKASELKAFLRNHGIPVLFGILDATYFQHFAIISQAAFTLLQDSISELQLQNCKRL